MEKYGVSSERLRSDREKYLKQIQGELDDILSGGCKTASEEYRVEMLRSEIADLQAVLTDGN